MEDKNKKDKDDLITTKKRPNVVIYTIFMAIIFFVITELVIWGKASSIILDSVLNEPQGYLVISEAVLTSLILIVLFLFGNSYVFTQKKERLTKGLLYGSFFLTGSILFSIVGIFEGSFTNLLAVLNLLIGCFLIGLAEELLCRGWLLNEFLERFGETKKGIWYSIIISGLIFGLMHLGNILNGQDAITTLFQVCNATGAGILFGLIYYKTKNIWSVVLLHGIWDFSSFLSDIAPITELQENFKSFSVLSMIFVLIAVFIQLLNLTPYLKDINAEPKKSKVILIGLFSFIFYLIFTGIAGSISMTHGNTYEYDEIEIEDYSVTKDNYEDYYIDYIREVSDDNQDDNKEFDNETYSFKVTRSNKYENLIITNQNTGYEVIIKCNRLLDYLVLEQDDYYILGYIDYYDSVNVYLKYYYIYKENITNDNSFLNNIKDNMKKYIVSGKPYLRVIYDRREDQSYISSYSDDYGYFVLLGEDKVSILK